MVSQEPKQQNRLMGEFRRDVPYEGRPGQTHAELIHFSCQCGAIFPLNVIRAVNVATDRELAEAAVAGNLNHAQCPYCSRHVHADLPYILHHPQEERFVLVIPEHLRHDELHLRSEALLKITKSPESPVPPYVAEFQVVFGTEGLRTSLAHPPGHIVIREELAAHQTELDDRERKATEIERVQAMRDAQLNEKEQAVEAQEESVMMREERLKERGEKITRQEDELRQKQAGQQARLEALEVRLQMLEQREAELAKREQALGVRTQTLQEWEARLQSTEQQQLSAGPAPLEPSGLLGLQAAAPAGHTDQAAPVEKLAAPLQPEQDIVTSLMRDPEHDELASEPTKRSRSMTAAMASRTVDEEEEAEELTDDDLIEEAEELSADDLIEGETQLEEALEEQADPVSASIPFEGIPIEGEGPQLPVLPGHDKAPPVAPPPAGMVQRKAPSAAPPAGAAAAPRVVPAQPPAAEPEPAPEPPAKPYLEPPPQWVRSGDPTTHDVFGGDVYLMVRLDEAMAERVKGAKADLWIQLHLMPTYPLITLTLVFDVEAEALEAIHWFIDIEEDLDRRLLQQLRRHFQANVLLYDLKYQLLDEVTFEPPREVNVAHVVDRATQELGEIGPSKLSPVQARQLFRGEWDWAGQKRHPFTEDAYAEISDLEEAKLALGILSYWTEPKNHEYLVLTKSVPVDLLDTITRRILDGAIRYGLWLAQPLRERAVALALAADLPALSARLIDAFAALGPEPEKLELADAAENWQRLLRDADELDIPLSKETIALAEELIERSNASEKHEEQEDAPRSLEDLKALPDDELLALLERRGTRKKALLVLAERENVDHLEAMFRAARKMGRPDLVPVIPALLRFGESAGDYFVEGLTARKSFTRQACAIALGELKLRRAVVPLLHQLIAEKTPVWHEIARTLGRYGATGIKPLHRYLRDPKGKEERLIRAMAFFAIQGAVKQVEEIASSNSSKKSTLGKQALEMRESARAIEEQVKSKGKIEEAAPLLRFSRRLYQAIAGEQETGEEALLEELGESDIMEIEDGEE